MFFVGSKDRFFGIPPIRNWSKETGARDYQHAISVYCQLQGVESQWFARKGSGYCGTSDRPRWPVSLLEGVGRWSESSGCIFVEKLRCCVPNLKTEVGLPEVLWGL